MVNRLLPLQLVPRTSRSPIAGCDAVPVPGSQRVTGIVSYGSTSAVSFLTLDAGTHTVTMQYQTATAFTFDPVSFDWQTASLQVLAFDQ